MTMRRRLLAAILAPLALALAGPASAWAITINEDFQPQNEFKLDPWISLKLGPVDMSINKAVLYLVLASVLTVVTMTWIARRMQNRPNRVQTAIEAAYVLM